MSSLQDPLRFGAADTEGDVHEEISLVDDPPATPPPTLAPSPPRGAPPPGAAAFDPLTSQPYEPQEQRPKFKGPLGRTSSSSSGPAASLVDPLSPHTRSGSGGHASGSPGTAPGPRSPALNGSSMLEDVDIHHSESDKGYLRNAAADAAGPSRRPGPRLQITVGDPVKRFSDHSFIPGMTSSHYEYLVTSTSASEEGGSDSAIQPARAQVRRRFNDFVALADLLEETHRGYFIFPRPDKAALEGAAAGRSEGEFVESRRSELERYLRRLAAHPALGGSEELLTFLRADGALAASYQWQQLQPMRGSLLEGVARLPRQLLGTDPSVPTTTDAAKNARYTNDVLRRLKELGERVKQEYQSPAVLPEEEVKLREAKAGVEVYSETLATASRRAERLVREFERVGLVTGDLGLSLIRLAKYEDEQGGRCGPYTEFSSSAKAVAADARRVGIASVRMSRLARSATAETMGALEPLHTELALAPAALAALKEREAALLTAHSIQDELDKKRAALAAAEGGAAGDASKARKAGTLRNEIAAAEAALEAAQAEYERVRGRNQAELARWRTERAAEFQRMARGFAQVAALYEERAEQVWRGVEEDLGGGDEAVGAAEAL